MRDAYKPHRHAPEQTVDDPALRPKRRPDWTQEPPTEIGLYWHWHGDPDASPVPLNIGFSGTSGKHFVMMGQYGLTRAIDCDEYGGWWLRLHEPPVPTPLY